LTLKKWFVAAPAPACSFCSLFVTLNLQVAYFLQSAEMASDDKFEEKMKVDSFNLYIPASLLIFPHRTSVLSLPILLLKIERISTFFAHPCAKVQLLSEAMCTHTSNVPIKLHFLELCARISTLHLAMLPFQCGFACS
jgi:hypothetical protein